MSWDGTTDWTTSYSSDTGSYGRYDNSVDRYPDDHDPMQSTGVWSAGHQGTTWDATDNWPPQQRRGEAEDEFASTRRWRPASGHDERYDSQTYRHDVVARGERDDEPDVDDDEPERGYLGGLLMTVVWYVVPTVLYFIWSATLAKPAGGDCVEATDEPCLVPRTGALRAFSDSLPQLATAFALSLVLALIIRLIASSWRAVTVGFAAAVVGAGIATVAYSLMTGASITTS